MTELPVFSTGGKTDLRDLFFWVLLEFSYHAGYDAEYVKGHFRCNGYDRVVPVLRNKTRITLVEIMMS